MTQEYALLNLYADDEGSTVEAVKKEAEKIVEMCDDRLTNLRSVCLLSPKTLDPENFASAILDVTFSTEIKRCLDRMYRAIVETDSFMWKDLAAATAPKFLEDFQAVKTSDAKANFIDGRIIVHCPLLASRYVYTAYGTSYSSIRKSKLYPVNYSHIYSQDVRSAISELLREIPRKTFEMFREKTVTFFSVYPSNEASLLDSDNHDTKTITDAITDYLPGGDDAPGCDFSFKTVLTDEIEPGSYIVISPGGENETKASEMVNLVTLLGKKGQLGN